MSTNKQALRELAEWVGREEWHARKEPGIGGEHTVIVKGSLVKRSGWSTHRPVADQVVDKKTAKFIAAASPATVLALLDELEAAEKRIAEMESREVVLPSVQDVHPLGPQSAKIFCEFHRNIINRCADEIRKVGVNVSIKGE